MTSSVNLPRDGTFGQTGLILGKFLPPHQGHQYLFDFARASVAHLTVLVCSLAREPIPGPLRHRWVAEMCPGATVLHVTDENPSEPRAHPDFWRLWIDTIRRHVPAGPEVVFTSEKYGEELARRLGSVHVPVDPGRELVPISGTALRAHPLEHWPFLPLCVRPYFVKRVCVVGPESTGKTTLCKNLADHYGTVWVSEYARGYLDLKAASWEASDMPIIARGQAASEAAMARQAHRLLFCDTDLLTTILYSELYYGNCPAWMYAAAEDRAYDLTLVTDADVPWVADPQRNLADRREEVRDRLVALLTRYRRPFVMVRGSWDDRFTQARQAVDALLTASAEVSHP